MRPTPSLILGLSVLLLSNASLAQVTVGDPWVRATVAQQKATGAFMTLTATKATRVVGASSPAAGVVEIHEMNMDGGVMKMRALPVLDLPAGKAVELRPGSYHVMLMDLKSQAVAGTELPITLVLEGADKKRETLLIKAQVRAAGAAAMH